LNRSGTRTALLIPGFVFFVATLLFFPAAANAQQQAAAIFTALYDGPGAGLHAFSRAGGASDRLRAPRGTNFTFLMSLTAFSF